MSVPRKKAAKPLETLFEFSIKVFSDGSYDEKIELKPGAEAYTAQLLFSMSTGKLSESLLTILKQKQPNEAKIIDDELKILMTTFMEQASQLLMNNIPVVRATEVFPLKG